MQINTDRLVSLIAMVIGLGSLFIIVYQTALLREQQDASALPYLMIGLQVTDERSYVFARNTGVGPALIEDVVVALPGPRGSPGSVRLFSRGSSRGCAVRWLECRQADSWVASCRPASGSTCWGPRATGNAMAGILLGVFDVGEVPHELVRRTRGLLKSGPDKAIIEVTYRSVYGDRWRVTSDGVVPKPL